MVIMFNTENQPLVQHFKNIHKNAHCQDGLLDIEGRVL